MPGTFCVQGVHSTCNGLFVGPNAQVQPNNFQSFHFMRSHRELISHTSQPARCWTAMLLRRTAVFAFLQKNSIASRWEDTIFLARGPLATVTEQCNFVLNFCLYQSPRSPLAMLKMSSYRRPISMDKSKNGLSCAENLEGISDPVHNIPSDIPPCPVLIKLRNGISLNIY